MVKLFSDAKFALFFELSKCVFLTENYSKACNSLVFRALSIFVGSHKAFVACIFASYCFSNTCLIRAHAPPSVHPTFLKVSESMLYQALGVVALKLICLPHLFRRIKNYKRILLVFFTKNREVDVAFRMCPEVNQERVGISSRCAQVVIE